MNQTTISGIATPSFIEDMRHIILRDVAVLLDELEQIPEELLWETLPGVQNSAGTLILHLCGNLRHFIGAVLASDGYKEIGTPSFQVPITQKRKLLMPFE